MTEYKYLDKTKWHKPDSYFGHNPEGDYVVYAKNRDSQILDKSNFDGIFEALSDAEKKLPADDDREKLVTTWRASHWACGWVEYLMLDKNAPDSLKTIADNILHDLSNYPVYSENDYCERQYTAALKYWDELSEDEKKEYNLRDDESIPDDLLQSEMFY